MSFRDSFVKVWEENNRTGKLKIQEMVRSGGHGEKRSWCSNYSGGQRNSKKTECQGNMLRSGEPGI